MSMNLSGRNARRGLALLLPLGLISFGLAAFGGDTPKAREKKMVIRVDPSSQATFLGVEVEEETGQSEGGARITRVVPDSAASQAGLEDGDVIVEFGDQPVRGPGGLTRQVRAKAPGDKVRIVVLRDGRKQTLQAELAQREGLDLDLSGLEHLEHLGEDLGDLDVDLGDLGQQLEGLDLKHLAEGAEGHRIRIVCRNGDCKHLDSDEADRPLLGVQIVETTPELNRHLGGAERAGVLISKVIDGSAAQAAGIRVGDLIVSISGQEISDVGDVRRAIGDKAGESVQVEVIRDRAVKTIEVELPQLDPEAN